MNVDRALHWFIGIWVCLALFINILAVAGMFLASGFWDGLARVQDTYSPFNIGNFVMEIILLSPALIAAWWLERRKSKRSKV
jgi:hypothetical protein